MSGESTYQPNNGFTKWMDTRLPLLRLAHDSFVDYPTPKNLNYWWTFGGILTFCLVTQIITGIILAMHYTPHVDHAFNSVEHIMRNVNHGWLIRYIHANGASMFFLAVYIHIFRGMYYGSYKAPREVLWILGVIIYLLMMAAAFMGYVLPWGQMSLWGATVITNLFGANQDFVPYFQMYINAMVKQGQLPSNSTQFIKGFQQFYIDRMKQQAAGLKAQKALALRQDKIRQMPQFLNKLKTPLMAMMMFYKQVQKMKAIVLKKMNQAQAIGSFQQTDGGLQVTEPEGFVAVDKTGNAVKLVDRLGFSRRNLTAVSKFKK